MSVCEIRAKVAISCAQATLHGRLARLLNVMIIGDRSWVFEFVWETSSRHSGNIVSTNKTTNQVHVRVMLTVFLDICRVVHHECAPQCKNIT